MIQSKIPSFTRQIQILKFSPVGILRRYSSAPSSNLVLIDVNDKNGIATVTMNSPPVNSFSLEFLTALSNSLDVLNKDNPKGMILTSSAKTVFTAGIDINELYKPNIVRARDFWTSFQNVWMKLYGAPYPTAAAINGHAPAGGCVMAMSCEYRVMVKNYNIGLNETQLGIIAPTWVMAIMRNTISARDAEMALTLGTLFKTEEALKIGLIDEVAADKAEAIAKCEAFLNRYQKIPSVARASTKLNFRNNDIQQLRDNQKADVDIFIDFITGKQIQKSLSLYMKLLKVRKIVKSLTKPFTSVMKMFSGKSRIKQIKK